MTKKATYEELEQKIKVLEKESCKLSRAEEELNRYQFIIESAQDAIFYKDLESRYITANKKTIDAFGLSKEDVIGKNDYELMQDLKEAQENVRDDQIVFKKGKSTEIIKHMTGADGKEYWFQAIKVPQFDNGGKVIGLVGIARDITEHKCAEENNKKLEAQLRQASKMESIGTLAGGIAHDFNNILEVILGNTELALGDIREEDPANKNLKEIKIASIRAAGIVRQLLNFSHKTDQELKPIDAVHVIKEEFKLLRSAIPSTIEIRPNINIKDLTILSDPVQINQILMNICSNASQVMEETGGILQIDVEKVSIKEDSAESYRSLDNGDYLKITISDTGPGIEPEIIDQIFDPYFTTKEFGRGTGMGLSIVHSIVKSHNGAITVESQPGEGAVFTLFLPVVDEKPEIEAEVSDEILPGSESILFVDDEKTITDMVKKILERLGYRIITKENPLDALELFESKPNDFDLVITDMTMPQMTGLTLTQRLKDVRPDVPVVLFTGHHSLINEQESKKMGFNACMMKPIMVKDVARIIRNVLDN